MGSQMPETSPLTARVASRIRKLPGDVNRALDAATEATIHWAVDQFATPSVEIQKQVAILNSYNTRRLRKLEVAATGRSYYQLVQPFEREEGTGDKWVESSMTGDLLHVIERLSKSDQSENKNLGLMLLGIMNREVAQSVDFIASASGQDAEVRKHLPQVQAERAGVRANISRPSFTFDIDHLSNMAREMASDTRRSERLSMVLPFRPSEGFETGRCNAEINYSTKGIAAKFDMPVYKPVHKWLREYGSASSEMSGLCEQYHQNNAEIVARLKEKAASGDVVAAKQLELRHTPAAVALHTISPDDPELRAQLAVRGGLAESPEAVKTTIDNGLLQKIASSFQDSGLTPSLFESNSELTLKGEQGEGFTIKIVGKSLAVDYQNPVSFRGEPGKCWAGAMEKINQILGQMHEYFGFDTSSVKVEVPVKYREATVPPNIELLSKEKLAKTRLEWIGGYPKSVMDKIYAAAEALELHFGGEKSPFTTAPNVIFDGITGTGKTEVSRAMLSRLAERLPPGKVAMYRLNTVEGAKLSDVVKDIEAWYRVKGNSILLVEDLWQLFLNQPREEVDLAVKAFLSISKDVAQSSDKVMVVNTENLKNVIQGRQAAIEFHRYPYFIELALDQTPLAVKDCFRAVMARMISKDENRTVTKEAEEVNLVMQKLEETPKDARVLWEALLSLAGKDMMTPNIIDVMCERTVGQLKATGANWASLNREMIMALAPEVIESEMARIKTAGHGKTAEEINYKVETMWKALQPLAVAGELTEEGMQLILQRLSNHDYALQVMLEIASRNASPADRDKMTDAMARITLPPAPNTPTAEGASAA